MSSPGQCAALPEADGAVDDGPRRRAPKKSIASIFVHAGAGYHSVVNEKSHLQACTDAARIGMSFLRAGATATQAVEAAIRCLEDREITNAGFGSNLNMDGVVECDATIVDHLGRSGACGAVAGVKNPISLAKKILDLSSEPLSLRRVPPNILVGPGAREFAEEHALKTVRNEFLVSRNAKERYLRWNEDLKRAEARKRPRTANLGVDWSGQRAPSSARFLGSSTFFCSSADRMCGPGSRIITSRANPSLLSSSQRRTNWVRRHRVPADPLADDAHVAERCRLVFEAGVAAAASKRGSAASAASIFQIVSILSALAATPSRRGQLAQQGAVRVLVHAWNALPRGEDGPRRVAAHALARILVSVNPQLVFAHLPEQAAVAPLASLLAQDPAAETRDLLPAFEALMALTNLASGGGDGNATRRAIVGAAWDAVEELLFANNERVRTAAVELICNLVQDPEQAVRLFGDGSAKAATRIRIVLAMADAEDEQTRSAAGGALACISALDGVARQILAQPRGADVVLGLCRDDSEGLRHRGAVVVDNLISHEGEVGKLAKERLLASGGVQALAECAKKSRTPEVVQAVVHALEVLLEGRKNE
ncbi:hypothetical protein VTH06DRAFT_1557 [Thermothelomyces fergusii]